MQEFGNIIKIFGFKITYKEIHRLFQQFDSDDSGKIEFEDFSNLMTNYLVGLQADEGFYEGRADVELRVYEQYGKFSR